MKCLLKLSFSLIFHFSTYKIFSGNCDVFVSYFPLRSSWEAVCLLSRKLAIQTPWTHELAAIHFDSGWQRLSKRSWVSWSPMILPVSNGVLGCGEYAPLLVEWETFVYFTNTTKKATKGEHLWCLWLRDAYDQRWLGWFSGQQTQDERFRIILPTTQPKCANEINRNPLETHRIQLFWLNYHIHGKLQAVYWKISPLSPAIFCSSVLFMFPAFSPPGKGPVFFGKD